jgi:hypothetical protein
MSEIVILERVLWGASVVLNVALVFLIFYRGNHRVYPFFCIYAVSAVLQNIAFFASYRIWGFYSPVSVRVAWGTQAFVTMARALAVAEVCYRALASYRGIWGLASRLLLGAVALVSLYSWAASSGGWRFAILNLDRGLELAMASVISLLVVFARSYELSMESATRTLAIGLLLYSSFRVLNDTMWGRWLNHYTALWGLLGTFTFLVSLLLWVWALRVTVQRTIAEPQLLPESHYRYLSPVINARLRALNDQLDRFWQPEGGRS